MHHGVFHPNHHPKTSFKIDLAYDICLVELASPMVESDVVGFADLPATPQVSPSPTLSNSLYSVVDPVEIIIHQPQRSELIFVCPLCLFFRKILRTAPCSHWLVGE